MKTFESLDAQVKNLMRVYAARNENDLRNIMEVLHDVLTYVQNATATHAPKPHRYVEDRAAYLDLK